jgi:pimeloyl-ACP methyl ester carboxylesterase
MSTNSTLDFAEEAALLADAAYSDTPLASLGWRPLTAADLGSLPDTENGVQIRDVGIDEQGETFSTAAHAYIGEAEGETVVALAFRGTDEGTGELLFQVGAWDEYYEEHEELVEAITNFAATGLEDGNVDRLLITGHSLGGILAETAAAEGLDDPTVREAASVITFGSPGSPAVVEEDVDLVNIVHTDDSVAAIGDLLDDLSDEAALFLPDNVEEALDELGREGEDVLVERPEGQPFTSGDTLDLLTTLQDSDGWEEDFLVEHDLDLYIQTAYDLEAAIA